MQRTAIWILACSILVWGAGCSRKGEERSGPAETGTRPETAAPAETGAVGGTETAAPPAVSAHAGEALRWETSWDAAMERARKEKKPVVVDFYADWCVWCKTLDSTTYKDPAVVKYLTTEVVPLKIDVDHGGRELARRWRVSGLPTILIVSADGKELGRIPGYLPAKDFLAEVRRSTGS